MQVILWIQSFLTAHPNLAERLDVDGDGWSVRNGDCNDSDATVYRGAHETPDDDIDQDCDGTDLEVQQLIAFFDSVPSVTEAVSGDRRVNFGDWTLVNVDGREMRANEITLQILVSENPDDPVPLWPDSHPSLADDFVTSCVITDTTSGATVGGPENPGSQDGSVSFTDYFVFDSPPFKFQVECDLANNIPANIGLMVNVVIGAPILEGWFMEDINGDQMNVQMRAVNNDANGQPKTWVLVNEN